MDVQQTNKTEAEMKATHLKYINTLQWFVEKNNDLIWYGKVARDIILIVFLFYLKYNGNSLKAFKKKSVM